MIPVQATLGRRCVKVATALWPRHRTQQYISCLTKRLTRLQHCYLGEAPTNLRTLAVIQSFSMHSRGGKRNPKPVPIKCLIVDDDAIFRQALRRALENESDIEIIAEASSPA